MSKNPVSKSEMKFILSQIHEKLKDESRESNPNIEFIKYVYILGPAGGFLVYPLVGNMDVEN